MAQSETDQPKEIEQDMNVSPIFVISRPGGNDTALFLGLPTSIGQRKAINDAIMGVYPNVEQVGFVNLNPQDPELQMAGGEFCGNATRATAWQVLKGQKGDIEIKVSGVDRKLKAGVTADGEAYAQMPVYPDPAKIIPDSEKPGNYTVEMEGITHYIDFDTSQIDGLTLEQIKKQAFGKIKERGLDKYSAAGIMYTEKTDNGVIITPVVYVRDIDTLFYETACGSGTAALGLATALETGASVDKLPVIQPSGLPIKISVSYENGAIGYSQIEGPIEDLVGGTLEKSKNRPYAVEQISDLESLQIALQERGLREAYKDAYGRAPYFESFEDHEVDEVFADYVRDGSLLVAIDKGEIISFATTQPLISVPEIGDILAGQSEVDPSSWYIPDVGLRKEYEGIGIAKNLMKKILHMTPSDIITLRTTVLNIRSQGLYHSLGFKIIPNLYQEITHYRVTGEQNVDKRLFMIYSRNVKTEKNQL